MLLHVPLFEYRECRFSELPEMPFGDMRFLDGLEGFLKRANLSDAMSVGRRGIRPKSYVGVIKYKNVQFEILPKILSHDEDRSQILKNLIYMLCYTKKLDIKNVGTADLFDCENPFLETLIRIFADSLFDALRRFSPKAYVAISENIRFLKGRLNMPAHIRHNSVNMARFFCDFDEFSENNVLNQLFLYVATCLHNISLNQQNKKMLKLIINCYSDIDFVRFYPHDLAKISLTRNQAAFATAFKLACMFIEHSSVDMSRNMFDNVALVWDMNKLFEEFVAEFLKRHKAELQLRSVVYQRGRRLLKSKENNKYYADTYVDIFITRMDGRTIVLDTKYKNNDGKYGRFSNADVFQVTTYCRLHNSGDAVLLYPATDDNDDDVHSYYLNVPDDVAARFGELQIKTARLDVRNDLHKNTDALVKRLGDIISQ